MNPIPERQISGLLLRLRECVCQELSTTLAGPVCRCHLVHSEVEILDGCDCVCDAGTGRAYIRILEISLVTLTDRPPPCPTGWKVDMEIGVARCVLDCQAELPPDETLEREVLYVMSDYAALRRAVTCCAKNQRYKPVATRWRPLGPEGCCYGGALNVEVTIS